jgi:hypothetical protein
MANINLANVQKSVRTGIFVEGRDKLDRPYEEKVYDNGDFSKKLALKNGRTRYTITKSE